MVKLLEKHGYNIFRNGKNHCYSEEFKKIVIDCVLLNKESVNSVAIDIELTSSSILHNWVKKYKENFYNVIEKPRGRTKTITKKIKKTNNQKLTLEEKIKELEKKNLYLEAENEYLKKLNALVQKRELQKKKESE